MRHTNNNCTFDAFELDMGTPMNFPISRQKIVILCLQPDTVHDAGYS